MSNANKNIVLVGFMGTGKSTVGALIAAKLGRVFFDVDTAIEHRTGFTIPRIFAEHSEPFFRAIEKGLIHEVLLQRELVIATGGGAVVNAETRQTLLETCFVVCLTASMDAIEARLRLSDARPLAGQWRELYAQRRAIYAEFHHQIDTSDATVEQVGEEVLTLWRASQ